MPPALSASSSAASSPGNATAVLMCNPLPPQHHPQAALVSQSARCLVSVVCGVALFRILRQCLAFKRQLAKKKGERSIRPFVLRSGSSTVGLVAGSQGPKPLLLPTMSTVRSSRGKRPWLASSSGSGGLPTSSRSTAPTLRAPRAPLSSTQTSRRSSRATSRPTGPPGSCTAFPRARRPSRVSIIPVTVTESKPLAAMISEDLLARDLKLECNPDDEFSVDIVEVSPSTPAPRSDPWARPSTPRPRCRPSSCTTAADL
ncbi:uncharacterized protein B0H18DRAFT_982662, partial [Fomitopsis serialis]|uniref:uncharacterized protein n=1 Tax=Fomitopsis serialis TaxID=139415 RepID=UPI002008B6BB